jgi:hypothetical protein
MWDWDFGKMMDMADIQGKNSTQGKYRKTSMWSWAYENPDRRQVVGRGEEAASKIVHCLFQSLPSVRVARRNQSMRCRS